MSENSYIERIRAERWPSGPYCPRCGDSRCSVHMRFGPDGRRKYRCYGCGRSFSDLTGTIFARSRLPLWKWFVCAKRILQGEPTCRELAGRLKVKVATAWRMRKTLRKALTDKRMRSLFEEGL